MLFGVVSKPFRTSRIAALTILVRPITAAGFKRRESLRHDPSKPSQHLTFDAGGIVRTDYASAATQKPSVTGWSFLSNAALTSCSLL